MDPFEKPYWPRRLVEIWVGALSRDAIRLAAHEPGTVRFVDLSLGSDGLDDEKYDADNDLPVFDNEEDLIYELIIRGYVPSLEAMEDAKRELHVACADDRLKAYQDPNNPRDQFFRREDVLKLWPEKPVVECLEDEATGDMSTQEPPGAKPDSTDEHEAHDCQETSRLKNGSGGAGEQRRSYSLDQADRPHLEKMDEVLKEQIAWSRWRAARHVAETGDVAGGGTTESKARRLHQKYKRLKAAENF